jgi:MFS family permease
MKNESDAHGPSPRPHWIERLRSLSVDFSPVRESRDYRYLWLGYSVTWVGSRLTFVAIPFQIYDLTGSTLAVGLLGLCELVPILTLSLFGGAIADAFDRRKLLLLSEACLALTTLVLLVNTLQDDPAIWLIYVMTVLSAALYALSSPAYRSTAPLLLRKDQLPASAALHGVSMNLSEVVGPLLAGVLIESMGLAWTYGFDVATFMVSLWAISRIRPLPPREGATRPSRASVMEGLHFLKGRKVLQGSFLVDINAMVFGMPNALFPAIASRFGGAGVLGALYAAPAVGALVAAATSGWTAKIRRHGMAVYVAVIGWGATLALFGLTSSLVVALLMLALAGAADMISAIFRTTILQSVTPDHMIGRLSGLELTVVASGPALGDLEAGALAALTNIRFSVVFGGLACIAGVGVLALALPEFHRYVADDPAEGATPTPA